jgi:hypothetical protein
VIAIPAILPPYAAGRKAACLSRLSVIIRGKFESVGDNQANALIETLRVLWDPLQQVS